MKKNLSLETYILRGIVLFSVLFLTQCKKAELAVFPKIDQVRISGMPANVKMTSLAANGIISTSFYLENALPSGYVKDGSTDYTSFVQAAVNKYSNIVFPGFPILINTTGIRITSNKTISFLPGSEIRLKGSSVTNYNMLHIYSATNVTLYNPVIVGDRNSHIGTTGEFGMGIAIRGSSNITIYSPKVSYCWGDGIYIGQTQNLTICKNIVIKDAYLYKNRRDGISIIGVDGLLLDNIYAGYTDGTKPWCGINFEPDNASCELKNIRVNNPRTEYNGANGIQIIPFHMLEGGDKTADITIVNHVDLASVRYAVKMYCNPPVGSPGKLYANFNFVNPTWHKALTDNPLKLSTTQTNIKTNVSSPEIMITNGTILSYNEAYTLLMKQSISANISVTNVTDPKYTTPDSIPDTPEITNAPIFAVNCGGSTFTSFTTGIIYQTDKNYSGGSIYKSTNEIAGTLDDELYRSERFGNFNYNIPLANGTYEITFKFAEIYQKASNNRIFDVIAEGSDIISNLDIYALAGPNKAYDLIKTVDVIDGALNINFRTDIDNAKISAFYIYKK